MFNNWTCYFIYIITTTGIEAIWTQRVRGFKTETFIQYNWISIAP